MKKGKQNLKKEKRKNDLINNFNIDDINNYNNKNYFSNLIDVNNIFKNKIKNRCNSQMNNEFDNAKNKIIIHSNFLPENNNNKQYKEQDTLNINITMFKPSRRLNKLFFKRK